MDIFTVTGERGNIDAAAVSPWGTAGAAEVALQERCLC